MRLHVRLMFLVGIAAGPALGLLIHSQSATHTAQLAQVQLKAQDLALSATFHTETRIQSLQQVLSGFAAMLPQVERNPALWSEAATKLGSGFRHVVFRAISHSTDRPDCGKADRSAGIAERPVGASGGAPTLALVKSGAIYTKEPDAMAGITLAEPVIIDGKIAGTIKAHASAEWLTEGLGRFPLSQNTMIMLADSEGYVFARRPDPGAWLGRRLPDRVMEQVRMRQLDGTSEIDGLGERPVLAAAAAITSLPKALFVVVGLDHEAELGPIKHAGVIDVLVLALVILAIVATAVASWDTAGMLLRREQGLSEAKAAAERLAEGQQRIADTIGHDLRNSVQTLVSFLRNIRRNVDRPPDPLMMPYVARAIGDVRSALDVLIRASRLEANALEPQKRPVQLSTFLKKIANDWNFYAETKGIELTVTAGRECVDSDPDLLRTILSNLVSNAIKHTESGGVFMSTATEADGRVAIMVRDTGKGIPADKAKVIFDAFSRLEPEKTEGLGLGLSICKRSADLLGCELSLDEPAEGGSRFVVRLPAAPESAAAST